MDNSWPMKGGSTFPPSAIVASSSSREPRNQMGLNLGQHFYPHIVQGSRYTLHGRTQDSSFSGTWNSSSCGSSCADDMGNSFLAIHSCPQTQLHSDAQEASHNKTSSSCRKLSENFTVNPSADGAGVEMISSRLVSQTLNSQNTETGANGCPVVSSRVVSSNNSRNSVLNDSLRVRHLSFQNIQPKAVAHNMVPDQTSNLISGCPRAFCLNTSGYLLLSNTGRIGIICSCHSWHMSVSDFCEHSGSFGVNPSVAVRMESGETIAQWRKLYFQKFGIRVAEDQIGWDCAQGFSAGSVRSCSIASNKTNFCDSATLLNSHGNLIRSAQTVENTLPPKVPETNQNLVEALYDIQQRSHDSIHLLSKGLTNTSGCNPVADNQMLEYLISISSTVPTLNSRQSNVVCPSASARVDSVVETGNSSASQPTFQSLSIPRKSCDTSSIIRAKDAALMERDTTFSNIELKLGQPCQQSQPSGNLSFSVTEPKLLETIVYPSKSPHLEQMIHNVASGGEKEEPKKLFHCAAGTSDFPIRREVRQVNLGDHAFRTSDVIDVSQLEKLREDINKCSRNPPVNYLNVPPRGSESSKPTNNMINISQCVPKLGHFESHGAKCHPQNISWNFGDGRERALNVLDHELLSRKDKNKGIRHNPDGPNCAADSAFEVKWQFENSYSFAGETIGSTVPSFLAADYTSNHPHHSCVPPAASDTKNLSDYPGKFPNPGSSGVLISTCLPIRSGKVLPQPAVSANSRHVPGFVPSLLRQERANISPYILDDKMSLLALQQISDLSKQHLVMSSVGMNQELNNSGGPFSLKVPHSHTSISKAKEQWHGPDPTTKRTSIEVAVPLIQHGATGSNKDLNKYASERENSIQALLSCKPLLYEQAPSRNKYISQPGNNNEKCCQRIPCTCLQRNYNCVTDIKGLGKNNESRVGSSPDFLKQQLASVNHEASILFSSKFSKDRVVPSERVFSFDQSGNLDGKLPRGIIYDASFWRDVPSKQKANSDAKHVESPADVLNEGTNDEAWCGHTAAKCLTGSIQVSVALKKQEMSNVSAGSLGCAVTQASVEGRNVHHFTGSRNTGHADNPVVDEGSGIDECWSSDEALESQESVEFLHAGCQTSLGEEGSSKVSKNQSYLSLLDELKLIDSLTWKKGKKQIPTMLPVCQKKNFSKFLERQFKAGKRENDTDTLVHNECLKCSECSEGPSSCSFKSKDILQSSCKRTFLERPSIHPVLKSGRSALSITKVSGKRGLQTLNDQSDWEDDSESELDGNRNTHKILEVSQKKKLKRTQSIGTCKKFLMQEKTHEGTENITTCNSVKPPSSQQTNFFCRRARPFVCGKYGEISCGEVAEDVVKRTKFLSLSKLLKTTRRCTLPKDSESKLTSSKELKNRNFSASFSYSNRLSKLKKMDKKGNTDTSFCHEMNMEDSVEEARILYAKRDEHSADDLSKYEKEEDDESENGYGIQKRKTHTKPGPKYKETRMRSLYELTGNGRDSSSGGITFVNTSKCITNLKKGRFSKNACTSICQASMLCEINNEKSTRVIRGMDGCEPDALCSVCGSLDSYEVNCILKCCKCLIRVHQACYGILSVPKGDWYCRPCRTSSKNIVCVLCGYGGGAMTRALQSQTIVKSLLKAWNVDIGCTAKNPISSGEVSHNDDNSSLLPLRPAVKGGSVPVLKPGSTKPSTTAVGKMDLQSQSDTLQYSDSNISNLKIHNSITARLLSSSVKQWVHMVCGLWTPGTRCPNVHTMSAFDVSGASRPRQTIVCSVCNRPGGSCIQCRVMNCSVQFHPWCAHRKGLLQSEVEGDHDENVGFYGFCLHHSTNPTSESNRYFMDTEMGGLREKESTCARTEGYKGRKHDGFWHNECGQAREKGGCFVTQEQVNAWIHINGQKSHIQGLPIVPITSIDYDWRKEYIRYKQAKGWRHLVVYKSGIHALGLYTSRFISCGEMVVEYVGEIVGPRVADKRENEYESGKKLQYKSACYFFRIDKEHIIDATRKGGIARFVNHSCMPNCVAKVISIRSEKKVVFFAERDIYPGEEITYDYHFNHEDEGKKIPCFCNTKNCSRYLN